MDKWQETNERFEFQSIDINGNPYAIPYSSMISNWNEQLRTNAVKTMSNY